MRQRCSYVKDRKYKYYSGRGITVCERWLIYGMGFKNFCVDMGERPSMKHTLDRIDSTKGYSSDNCQWLLWQQNCVKRNCAQPKKTNQSYKTVDLA